MINDAIIEKQIVAIDKAIELLKKLQNTPRLTYDKMSPSVKDGPPFWIGDSCLKHNDNANSNDNDNDSYEQCSYKNIPNIDHIIKTGIVCVGLTNIVRIFFGLEIPGRISGEKQALWIGGTESWFKYLINGNRLEIKDFTKKYPNGTLLLQNYNLNDNGHVSIVIESNNNGLLESKIIHNVLDKKEYLCGTYIHKVKEYSNYKRHTHICMPQNWLLKN